MEDTVKADVTGCRKRTEVFSVERLFGKGTTNDHTWTSVKVDGTQPIITRVHAGDISVVTFRCKPFPSIVVRRVINIPR